MIRVGLIGFGLAGRVFHAPLISSVEGLELAAVLERHSDTAAERYPGIVTYRSLEEIIADESLGLFVVATPNAAHFPIAMHLLEAGKNVVVDKPAATSSDEIARMMRLARSRQKHLIPFHNRRWDGDFLTLRRLIDSQEIGRIVSLASSFDRWRPVPRATTWKEDPAQGGMLLDIGTHLTDQALELFGKPEAVWAEQRRERDGEGSFDSFEVRLRYSGFVVSLSSNALSCLPLPRFHLRATKGNYWKWGLDPQEAALKEITRIHTGPWGEESRADWGTLSLDVEGHLVTEQVSAIAGDYRMFYAGVRDALLGVAPEPVTALAAWRVARLLEWAAQSSAERREITCAWEQELVR